MAVCKDADDDAVNWLEQMAMKAFVSFVPLGVKMASSLHVSHEHK